MRSCQFLNRSICASGAASISGPTPIPVKCQDNSSADEKKKLEDKKKEEEEKAADDKKKAADEKKQADEKKRAEAAGLWTITLQNVGDDDVNVDVTDIGSNVVPLKTVPLAKNGGTNLIHPFPKNGIARLMLNTRLAENDAIVGPRTSPCAKTRRSRSNFSMRTS
jgi:hypothetical protein